ncbi:MAG: hypothetical protein FWG30_12015 [Eubacteriaceae bacterium]|nr:hypothetical protein [Eubacteriaceae bacterium]
MSRIKFSPQELEPTGEFYPVSPTSVANMPPGMPARPPEPVLKLPISPDANLKLLASGKRPFWIPNSGFGGGDVASFFPRISSDNVANRNVSDGGPAMDFSGFGVTAKSDWFDLEWDRTGSTGSSVRPGNPKIPDITRWEDFVTMPDLSVLDWNEMAEMNKDFLNHNKHKRLNIYCGIWERLMCLMDVTEACVALYDDDLKPHTHRFLDAYTNFLIEYISRCKQACDINGVMVTEDWCHQLGPFMSPEVASEMLVPYIKRITDWLHSNDMLYDMHMCGNTTKLIPCMIEAGADSWSAIQPALYDIPAPDLAKKYKNDKIIFGLTAPLVPDTVSDAELRQAASDLVEEFSDCNVMFSYFIMNMDPNAPRMHPDYAKAVYEASRIAYQDEE